MGREQVMSRPERYAGAHPQFHFLPLSFSNGLSCTRVYGLDLPNVGILLGRRSSSLAVRTNHGRKCCSYNTFDQQC
jgi:hypothetical protein